MIARFFLLVVAPFIGFGGTASAAECSGSKAVPGTLAASAAKPCVTPAHKQLPQEQAKPKDPPGTFRSGNTTVRIGGAIISDTVVGGR